MSVSDEYLLESYASNRPLRQRYLTMNGITHAYICDADIYCETCGKAICEAIKAEGKAPTDPDDEYSYDSDEYPKGPYPDGGGEADCPQHCADCGVFLENPLTSYGEEYVQEQVNTSHPESVAIEEWSPFYGIYPEQEEETEPQDDDYILTDQGHLRGRTGIYQNGKLLETFTEHEDISRFIREHMEENQFWPNVWYHSQDGSYELYGLD